MAAARPFKIHISDEELQDLREWLEKARVPPKTFAANGREAGLWGVEGEWMERALERWKTGLDWRTHEAHFNQFSQFQTNVSLPGGISYEIHYLFERSPVQDSVPLLLIHGWPGSFLEYIDLVARLKPTQKYHLVAPSLPGFLFSSRPPVERDVPLEETADVLHALMVQLGLGAAYAVQGGDLGAVLGRLIAVRHPKAVKCVHFNLVPTSPPKTVLHAYFPRLARWRVISFLGSVLQPFFWPFFGLSTALVNVTAAEAEGVARIAHTKWDGSAYGSFQATRSATAGWVVGASPVGLLAWLSEKFIQWSDKEPAMDDTLAIVTLWWVTNTFASSIGHYRHVDGHRRPSASPSDSNMYVHQPSGFSSFAKEIVPVPRAWAAQTCNLVWYRHHAQGGHFAAWEAPEVLKNDLDAFILPLFGRS